MLAIFAGPAFAQSALFTLGGTFPTGSSVSLAQVSTTIVVADFNGDAKADIITANTNDNTLTLLLGDGTGNFIQAPGSPITPGGYVATIASGDFNGDGNPDLVASSASGTTVLLGNGAGGFVKGGGLISPGLLPGGPLITLADFNGDRKLDLIAYSNGSSFLFPGNGSGAFGPPQSSPLSYSPSIGSIVAGDFNGDGKMDLAALPLVGTTANGEVFNGDGTGRFQPVFDFSISPYSMGAPSAAADFNGAGKTGILTFRYFGSSSFQSQTWSWTGNTSSILTAFSSTQSSAAELPASVITGDFDGHGKTDWAGVSPGLGVVTVYLGDGTGRFTEAPGSPYSVGGAPVGLAAGDFNGDGKTDLAVDTGSAVVILLNVLNAGATPAIQSGGVVPVFSNVPTIQPGEWASIYGTNLGSAATWTGNFPETLGGASVTIDGKSAYLWYVSPGQINFQAPDDTLRGPVSVAVTTAAGTTLSTVNLAQFAPSFSLLDSKHVAGIIRRPDGSGEYGAGTYDIIGPTGNSLGYPTVAAKSGDNIEIFAVGLGPTKPAVPAGQVVTSAVPAVYPVSVLIGNVNVVPGFVGLIEAGLYQINLTVPTGLGTGDLSLIASVGGVQTPPNVVISLQ